MSATCDGCALNMCGNAIEMVAGGVVIRAIGDVIAERDTAALLLKLGVVDRGAGESASKQLPYVEGLSLLCCCLVQPSLTPLVDRPTSCEGFVCEVKRCALSSNSPTRLLAKRIDRCV